MKRISLIILGLLLYKNYVNCQNDTNLDKFLRFAQLYNSGDLFNAEKYMLLVLESKDSISEEYIVAAYNNLGATNTLLGNYKQALEYYTMAETQISEKRPIPLSLADIYINKAMIYTSQNSFSQAIEYLEKGIRVYLGMKYPDIDLYQRISTAYLNIGNAYYESKNYQTALEYLEKSAELKSRYNLPKIALVYFNIAKTYIKTNKFQKAEEFYLKSMDSFKREFGENYFRTAEVLFHYGLFLESEGRNSEALIAFKRALAICLKTYGDKNTFVSISYKYLGDYFLNQNNYDSSLVFYQKALIAIVNDFNDTDIFSNPPIDSSNSDINILDILKSKSNALEQFAMRQGDNTTKLKILKKSLENLEMAMQLINKIRSDYMNEESRIYLADNEKETYTLGINISHQLYSLTGDQTFVQKMYYIARQAKTAVLRNEITDNELFYSTSIPDTLQKKHKNILLSIGAYSKLIQDEKRKLYPNRKRMDFWQDNLFEMKRVSARFEDSINKQFPQYRELLHKTEPVSIENIQANLDKDETLVEYYLSNQYINGKRKLYIFLVTANKVNFLESGLDISFKRDVEIIKDGTVQIQSGPDPLDKFKDYSRALFNMYLELIEPVEDLFCGNRLIIVPDEEIAFLPFDAFLKSCPDSTQINYEELQYLIYHYTFSYGYSSSLIFSARKNIIENKVYAFSPDYLNDTYNSGISSDYLEGAQKEISSIFKWFPGKEYLGKEATETNFKTVIAHPAIIHLAMHSFTDPYNSKYSCLLFDPGKDSLEDGKLFNYEISLSQIKSPMVVLSSCNTGSGTLSQGEGINSLARGFILAGALSVVITTWDINDESSAYIISRFYYHLSKGKMKADAMHLAKLEYLKTRQPVYTNPYYWAGYEILGDNSPLVPPDHTILLLITAILIFAGGVFAIYRRWRIILSARS